MWTLGDGTGQLSHLLTTVLSWSCTDRNVRVQKVFNGYLRVTNENFLDAYENPNSTEFAELASKVKEAVSSIPELVLSSCCLLPGLVWEVGRAPRSQEGGSREGWWQGAVTALGACPEPLVLPSAEAVV